MPAMVVPAAMAMASSAHPRTSSVRGERAIARGNAPTRGADGSWGNGCSESSIGGALADDNDALASDDVVAVAVVVDEVLVVVEVVELVVVPAGSTITLPTIASPWTRQWYATVPTSRN